MIGLKQSRLLCHTSKKKRHQRCFARLCNLAEQLTELLRVSRAVIRWNLHAQQHVAGLDGSRCHQNCVQIVFGFG